MKKTQYPKLPQSTPPLPVEEPFWTKIIIIVILCLVIGALSFGALTYFGYTNGFMTDGQCDELLINASIYGYDTALFQVLNKTLACDGVVPINFANETYDIVAVRCLNLNNSGGK